MKKTKIVCTLGPATDDPIILEKMIYAGMDVARLKMCIRDRIKGIITKPAEDEEKKPSITEEELKYIIEEIQDEGVLEEQESELAQSALEFDEIKVGEILTPRVDVAALDISVSIQRCV